MNKGILQLALSGTVDLELEYSEPRSNGAGITAKRATAEKLQRTHAVIEIADAFAWLLHVMS